VRPDLAEAGSGQTGSASSGQTGSAGVYKGQADRQAGSRARGIAACSSSSSGIAARD